MAGTNSNVLVFENLGKGLENLIEVFYFLYSFLFLLSTEYFLIGAKFLGGGEDLFFVTHTHDF